ncbi:MAG: LysR family transcriptional regulator [Burkholderiaceae bacterium]|jgi:DNA-binding transcriptional LysR family regulator|nr:LysR family transcriptional regulator [Burkholderiaceae bacterium]
MAYSLEQLQIFAAIAKAGSFSEAARQMGRTQSSVSTAIANLEADWNVLLFDRSTKVPVMTESGRRLLREAHDVMESCLLLDGHAQSLGEANEARITLAIEVPYNVLMPPLLAFAQQFPFVDLDIRNSLDGDVSAQVHDGGVQLGVAFSQPQYERSIGFVQMGKLVMSHVVAREHPLAAPQRVSFAQLRKHRRLAFSALGERLPSSEYLAAPRCWRAVSYTAMLEMVKAGIGWATLPRTMILRELEEGQLVELRLEAYPNTDWLVAVDLLWNKGQRLSAGALWLKNELANFKVREKDSAGLWTAF